MPLLPEIYIVPPRSQPNGHFQTIIPNLTRKVNGIEFERERIDTWDDDFLDLDWIKQGNSKLVIVTHGLAGNSRAEYIKGISKIMSNNKYDILAWNYRGCGGEPNRKLTSFHGGKTDDLDWVIKHAIASNDYDAIYLVGVSMGGNLTLKYVGEMKHKLNKIIKKAFAVSAPIDMLATSHQLIKGWNQIYSRRYLKQYIEQLKLKEKLFPGQQEFEKVYKSANLHDFVENFTAKIFGFKDAAEYLASQSALHYLENIKIPTILVNADNDPFLTEKSFPKEIARNSDFFHFEMTINGGHVGFMEKEDKEFNWMEKRILDFFEEN